MKISCYIFCLFSLSGLFGQGIYAPAAGTTGTTAMHKDSNAFVSWAVDCKVKRGLQQIDNPSLGFASQGDSSEALGKANGAVVSLGDSGEALITLTQTLYNGTGPDFAIFENGFNATFLELAFVEVSSDGTHFVRFPSFSNTQDTSQIGSFGSIDATYIHNLAGKYQVNYGTPFDLEDLPADTLLNKNAISHIRIIDVVGNITTPYFTTDSRGKKINDPWPTPYASSGFDLDAVGLVHVNGINSITELEPVFEVFPNPFSTTLTVRFDQPLKSIEIIAISGASFQVEPTEQINLGHLKPGIYFIRIKTETKTYVKKVVKK